MWPPIGDCPIDKGSLAIASGSHKNGVLDTRVGTVAGGMDTAVTIPGTLVTWAFKAGDVLICSDTRVHKALPNKSKEIRQSLDARYQPASAPIAKTKFKTLSQDQELPRSVFWIGLWNIPVLLGATKLRSDTIRHKVLRGRRPNGIWNNWRRRPISTRYFITYN